MLLVARGILTLAEDAAPVRALLVDGEEIVWTGEDPGAAPPHRHTHDLGAAWVTPAFVDAHVHATATGLLATGLDLSGVRSAAELLAALRRHAADVDAPVVIGAGWDDFGWPEQRPPSATDLAEAAPGRTLHLARVDAHSCLVDAGTLARLPLDRLEGVDRDAGGQATGFLRERAAEAALGVVREALQPAQLAAARRTAFRRAAAVGIGALHEMGHPGMHGLDDARAWAQGDWPVEVDVWWAELDADRCAELGLRPGGDLFLDGSIGSRTAAVARPYRDGGGSGQMFHGDEEVQAFFTACTAQGRGAGVHAIGDRAIDQAVRAVEAASAVHGSDAVRRCRHRVEHLELPTRDHVRRLAALGVVASVQPAFDATWGGSEGLYAARFGADAAHRSNPLTWCAEEGMWLAFGSDSPVTPLDPWGAVRAAEHHLGGLGVDRVTALRAHTVGGRYVAAQAGVGPLAPGYRADLAVWDRDPLDDAALEQDGPRCLATVVRGRIVHGDLVLGTP